MSSCCKLCCLSFSDCGFCPLACRHACPTGLAELSKTLPTTSTLPDAHAGVQVIDATVLHRVLQEMQVTADRQRYCTVLHCATQIKLPCTSRLPSIPQPIQIVHASCETLGCMHRDIQMARTAARAGKGDPGSAAKQSPAGSSGRPRFSDVTEKRQLCKCIAQRCHILDLSTGF